MNLNILLDTNIIISLNDPERPLDPRLAAMQRLLDRLSFHIFIHPSQVDDFMRDTNDERRERNISRLAQYNALNSPPTPTVEEITELGWTNSSDNDRVDNLLLYALKSGAAHILVSEDKRLQKKAQRAGFQAQVHRIDQFIFFLETQFSPVFNVPLGIETKYVYQLHQRASFWDSLRVAYAPQFDEWFRSISQEHRQAWCICDVHDDPLAVCIFKQEENAIVTDDTELRLSGPILKLCTFKVSEELRGKKIGERLLFTAFRYAAENNFHWVYMHTHTQDKLIELCEEFGFKRIGLYRGDEVWAKRMLPPPHGMGEARNSLEYAKLYYPNYIDEENVQKFIVPIKPQYHNQLFPDISDDAEGLFAKLFTPSEPQSNTIKKAYICHSRNKQLHAGDLLLFYRTGDRRSIQVVGIVEQICSTQDMGIALALVSKRTVFSTEQLGKLLEKPVSIILFRVLKYVSPILHNRFPEADIYEPIQTIRRVEHTSYLKITGVI